jgi:hypothetical protein
MWQEEDYNDVMKKAAAASAAYAKPHVTTGYQSLVALQLLTDREGFKAAMLERLESADYESGRVQPLEDAMRAFAANGDIHYIPQLLRAAGEVDLKAQTRGDTVCSTHPRQLLLHRTSWTAGTDVWQLGACECGLDESSYGPRLGRSRFAFRRRRDRESRA